MGGDSCSKGHGFEPQHWIDIFHIYLLEELYCMFEKMKINEKEAEDGPFLKKKN